MLSSTSDCTGHSSSAGSWNGFCASGERFRVYSIWALLTGPLASALVLSGIIPTGTSSEVAEAMDLESDATGLRAAKELRFARTLADSLTGFNPGRTCADDDDRGDFRLSAVAGLFTTTSRTL